MARSERKRVGPGARNPWNSTLDIIEGAVPTQAGEDASEMQEVQGGGDKGLDSETGDGGYGGDAVEAGHDEAVAQPDKPLDVEIQGDPRTHEGSSYPPDPSNESDTDQRQLGESDNEAG